MKVFVAGATGVLGRRAVAGLVAAGHDVSGVARSPEKASLLEGLGARPATVDLFDAAAVAKAVVGHEAVCNLATHIPPTSRAALPRAWAENDRIRSQASAHLVDAALTAGAERYVQESITFTYADGGDAWLDEDAPLDVPPAFGSTLAAEGEAHRFTASGGTGVVLRFAWFYGPDGHHSVDVVRLARRRLAPTLGAPDDFVSAIHTDDAAAAVVAALGAGAGVWNVADDRPVTKREWCGALAAALGVKPPRFTPLALQRLTGSRTSLLRRSHRVSNRRFRDATGWAPAVPDVVVGWPGVVAELDNPTGGR